MILTSRKTVFVVGILVALMLFLAGCGGNSADSTVAEVNGAEITRKQLESYMNVNRLFDPSMDQMMGSQEGKAILEQQFLDQLVQSTLLKELAAELGIEVTAADSEQFFAQIKQQLLMKFGSEEELENQLNKLNITENDLMEPINSMLLQDALIDYYADGISEDEVAAYLKTNGNTGVTLEVSHILVDSEAAALQARERIVGGDEFAAVAKEVSSCPSSEQGGELGPIPADTNQYDQDFMAGANALAVDELSEPVKTQFGYHLILVTERSEPDVEQVRQILAAQKLTDAFESLRERSEIKKNLS